MFEDFNEKSQDVLRKEQITMLHEMKRIRLRALCSLMTEKLLRRAFHSFEANQKFFAKKHAMLQKLPLPRRKKWWEKLDEHKHDHFYREAKDILESVPRKYRQIYSLIIEHKLMKHVLVI